MSTEQLYGLQTIVVLLILEIRRISHCGTEDDVMAFDYKKEYKEFYLPSRKPHLITVPPMNFVTVQGKGDPNDPAGEYQAAMEVLYGLAYTIKMSYKGSHRMEGFFEYVVPPLEGLWHQQGVDGVDYAHKETFGPP